MKTRKPGFTLIEQLITVAVIISLAAIATSVMRSTKQRANQTRAIHKMKALGTAFATYTTDRNGQLPQEDAPGSDDWVNAGKPENQETWYNALPKLMGAESVGELGQKNPAGLYSEDHPLHIPGAPYPSPSKRVESPAFAVGMNSRLERRGEDGVKKPGNLSLIQDPVRTVVLLERGLPSDKKTASAQRGFDGSPKANPRAFAARHAQKGCLIFADGHAELHAASDLLTSAGGIVVPQTVVIWTMNPNDDPN